MAAGGYGAFVATFLDGYGLKKGERYRSLQRTRDIDRELYDVWTNLCGVDMAGPGMMLHLNLHIFIIVWSLLIACIWKRRRRASRVVSERSSSLLSASISASK